MSGRGQNEVQSRSSIIQRAVTRKRLEIGPRLLLMSNRKLWVLSQVEPSAWTSCDRKRSKRGPILRRSFAEIRYLELAVAKIQDHEVGKMVTNIVFVPPKFAPCYWKRSNVLSPKAMGDGIADWAPSPVALVVIVMVTI